MALALLGSMRGYRLKMRKRNDRREGQDGREGLEGRACRSRRRSGVPPYLGNVLREGEYFKVGPPPLISRTTRRIRVELGLTNTWWPSTIAVTRPCGAGHTFLHNVAGHDSTCKASARTWFGGMRICSRRPHRRAGLHRRSAKDAGSLSTVLRIGG
jgi:hypothetical protein